MGYERLKLDRQFCTQELEGTGNPKHNLLQNHQWIYLELLEKQRRLLHEMNHRAEFDEELIRKYLSLIDLQEFKLREKRLPEGGVVSAD
jgi:monovalent cation/hydrogen antiporter